MTNLAKMRTLALAGVLATGTLGLQACGTNVDEEEIQEIDLGATLLSGAAALSSAGDETAPGDVRMLRTGKAASTRDSLNFPDQADCDEDRSGWPAQATYGDGGGSGGTAEYNQAFMSCVMKSADTGGETALGAIARIYGTVCALGGPDGLIIDGESHDATVTIDTNCFTQAMVDQMTSWGVNSFEASYVGSTTEFYGNDTGEWTGSVRLSSSFTMDDQTQTSDTILLYKVQEGGVTVAAVAGPDDTVNQGSTYDGFVIQVDGDSGVVRFENRSQSYFEGTTLTEPRNRHIKMLLEGEMAENGSFSSLTNAEVLYSNLWATSSSVSNLAAFKTLQGNSTAGFKMNTFEQSDGEAVDLKTAGNYSGLSFCFTGGHCEGISGLTLENDADTAFILYPDETSTSEDWFKALIPPTWTSVSWTD